jgi:hypothetical protein
MNLTGACAVRSGTRSFRGKPGHQLGMMLGHQRSSQLALPDLLCRSVVALRDHGIDAGSARGQQTGNGRRHDRPRAAQIPNSGDEDPSVFVNRQCARPQFVLCEHDREMLVGRQTQNARPSYTSENTKFPWRSKHGPSSIIG